MNIVTLAAEDKPLWIKLLSDAGLRNRP